MKFGEYLKDRRTGLGWTQPEAAAKARIEQSYLSKLETGKAYPSEDVFGRLVEAFELDVDSLLETLFPGEIDRLREIERVRATVLERSRSATLSSRRWMIAGFALLLLGGGFLGFANVEADNPPIRYTYQSTGVILPGEGLNVFENLNETPGPTVEGEQIAGRDALLARVDELTRATTDYKGPSFIEPVANGKRVWRLVGGAEIPAIKKFSWASVPGMAFLIAGLGCFFISWRWR